MANTLNDYPDALHSHRCSYNHGCIELDQLSYENFLVQEPKQFNDFLRHLCKFCETHNLTSFLESLASKEIMLINKTEAADRLDTLISSNAKLQSLFLSALICFFCLKAVKLQKMRLEVL